jgi:hypothetical protein
MSNARVFNRTITLRMQQHIERQCQKVEVIKFAHLPCHHQKCLHQLLHKPLSRRNQRQTFSKRLNRATHRSDASASPPGLSIRRTTALIRLLSRTCRSCLMSASLPIPLPVLPPLPRLMFPAALMTAIRSLPAVTDVGLVGQRNQIDQQSTGFLRRTNVLSRFEVSVGINQFQKLKYHILALALAEYSGHCEDC